MNLRNTSLVVGVVTLAAGSAYAQMALPAKPDPAAAQPGTYQVEPNHTRVLFSVNHLGFTTYYGGFSGVTGSLTIDSAHPGSDKLSITLPIDTASTTNPTLDSELKAADWLDATKFPTATFESTSIKTTGAGTAEVTGQLTLHGQTHPLTLHVKYNGAGMNPLDKHFTVGFDAQGKLKRSEYGVSKYVPLVSDDVELILSAAFVK